MNFFSSKNIIKVMILSFFISGLIGIDHSYAQVSGSDNGLATSDPYAGYNAMKKKKAAEEAAAKKKKADEKAAKKKKKADEKELKNKVKSKDKALNNEAKEAQKKVEQMQKNYDYAKKNVDKQNKKFVKANQDYAEAKMKMDEALAQDPVDEKAADKYKKKMEKADRKRNEAKAEIDSSLASMERNSGENLEAAQAEAERTQNDLDNWNALSDEDKELDIIIEEDMEADIAAMEAEDQAEIDAMNAEIENQRLQDQIDANNASMEQMAADLEAEDDEDLDIDDELEIVDTVVVSNDNVGGIFKSISGKAADAVKNISQIAYVLAGFGMVAFTFGAIFGKLNWKHFGNIGIGLVMVASSGMIIEFFVTPPGSDSADYRYKLSYGDYISDAVGDTLGNRRQPSMSDSGGDEIMRERTDPISSRGPLSAPVTASSNPINNGTGITNPGDGEKKENFFQKVKKAVKKGKDGSEIIERGAKTYQEARATAETLGQLADAGVKAIKEKDLDGLAKVGDGIGRMGNETSDLLNSVGGLSNDAAGFAQTVGDKDYQSDSYRDNDTSAVDRVTNAVEDKIDNAVDTVDEVDDVVDELEETEDGLQNTGNYLGN